MNQCAKCSIPITAGQEKWVKRKKSGERVAICADCVAALQSAKSKPLTSSGRPSPLNQIEQSQPEGEAADSMPAWLSGISESDETDSTPAWLSDTSEPDEKHETSSRQTFMLFLLGGIFILMMVMMVVILILT